MPYKDSAKNNECKRKWAKQNPAYYRKYYKKNAEKIKQRRRDWAKANKNRVKQYSVKAHFKRYGLTVEEGLRIKKKGCAICGTKKGKLCIDHNHRNKKFRGCLCHSCNVVLGHARDSIRVLEKAIAYLKRFS